MSERAGRRCGALVVRAERRARPARQQRVGAEQRVRLCAARAHRRRVQRADAREAPEEHGALLVRHIVDAERRLKPEIHTIASRVE